MARVELRVRVRARVRAKDEEHYHSSIGTSAAASYREGSGGTIW